MEHPKEYREGEEIINRTDRPDDHHEPRQWLRNRLRRSVMSCQREFSSNPVVERAPEGEIYISGSTNFPDGMKMRIVLGLEKRRRTLL
jgi:hypothetical protein